MTTTVVNRRTHNAIGRLYLVEKSRIVRRRVSWWANWWPGDLPRARPFRRVETRESAVDGVGSSRGWYVPRGAEGGGGFIGHCVGKTMARYTHTNTQSHTQTQTARRREMNTRPDNGPYSRRFAGRLVPVFPWQPRFPRDRRAGRTIIYNKI